MPDQEMRYSMGGEVAEFVKQWKGTIIRCFGVCHKEQIMDRFVGYEHDGGLSDATGKRWWVYFECPKCGYGHSHAKMGFFLQHSEIERRSE